MKRGKSCSVIEEERLEQELERLRALSDGINEPVYVADPKTYEILFANKRLKELFEEKIVGKKCYKVFQNLNHPCPFCTNKHIFGKNVGKTYIWEFQNKKNKRWYRCIDKAIEWPGNKYVRYEMAIDITEQKKMEEALRESEKRYRNLIEAAPAVVYTLSTDGTITSLNPAFEKITGWPCDEWLGKSFIPIIHPDDLPVAMETSQRILRGETLPPYELRVLSKSGEYLVGEFTSMPIMEGGKVVGEFGVVNDATERKCMEEALRESEEFFRSVVENSHDGILIIDDNFRITYANEEAIHISGYPKEEIIGQDFRKFLTEESKSLVADRYLRRQRGERVPSRYGFKIVRKDGEKRDIEIKSTIIRDSQGKVQTISQILDITEHKRMEEERKRFEERLSALSKYVQSLSTAKDPEEVYTLALNAMEKTLGFEYASILMVEEKMLRLVAHRGYSEDFSLKLPLDGKKGVTVKAATTSKSVFIPDIRKEKAYVPGRSDILSELAVPIKLGSKVLGVLNVEKDRIAAFDQKDIELLETLASHTAIAISNLKRQEKLSALNIYGRSLNRAENMEEIHTLTLNAMEKILGFKFVDILLVEGKTLRLAATRGLSDVLASSIPLDGRKGVTVKAARLGKPVFVPDVGKEKAYVGGGVEGMLSELAVPIKLGNKVLGVLNVESERLAAFDEEDKELLEILASHIAIAISNLRRREQLGKISTRIANLMKSSIKIMRAREMRQRLKTIATAIRDFGWRRVVISLRDENLEGTDLVTVGLTKEENELLLKRKAPGYVWKERLGPKFERYKMGEFYYLPWSDPWVREYVHGVPPEAPLEEATTYAGVPSKLSIEEMVDWHPQDMLYAPLCTPDGKIVGILSMDDPIDGRKPTRESLVPLELFLHQAAITIENVQLIGGLREARGQLEVYAGQLEQKVDERTRKLKESQEQLLKAQRLAVIGELAGMVGHDLRNPLTCIAGSAYYVKKRLSSKMDSKMKGMIELIEKNITYSNKIINDLLDYSREIKLDLSESSPRSIIREALSLVEVPENVQVENLTGNKPKMKVDFEKIERAFLNIIRNAIEAMPKGGKLTIKSKELDGNIIFTLSDTGVGMSKETLQKLWTPLFTTKARGMGFGLPICKRIIEAHGGSISAKSIFKKGTAFTVTLPIEPKIEEGGEKVWIKPLESSSLMTTKT